MDLANITPVILTFNEEQNIGRVLEQLRWANTIVVVDSFSTDRTLEIVKAFPNTQLFQRAFDRHDRQWNYALHETGIVTDWALTLDADYIASDAFTREMAELAPAEEVGGYEVQFQFCIHGRPLRRSLYPGRVVLFRRARALFYQDGHTQRLDVGGDIHAMKQRLALDDRKSISHWVRAQDRYASLERDKLLGSAPGMMNLPDRIRRVRFLAPAVVFLYCLFIKGMIFEGKAGLHYTYQRVVAELLLAVYLIEADYQGTARHR
jgi:glycosyltransferase involved in cell wall biosynthesis